jgi:hypothetical protein
MRYRPRWGLLTFGALIVIGLFTFPLWRSLFARPAETVPFPLASPEQRAVFQRMPNPGMAATAYAFSLTALPIPTELAPPPLPPDAQPFLTAQFSGFDAVRRATGNVTFYRLIDDSVLMRFDDFAVTNAPNLVIYLSGNEAPLTREEIGGIVPEFLVGDLKGTTGSQQYAIPKELPLARYRSIVIVSEGLQSLYGTARLR